jgi:hypothetical protein
MPDKCPYCKREIDYGTAYGLFVNQGDYETCFRCPCPSCQKEIEVTVESVPDFRFSKVMCDFCRKVPPINGKYYCQRCMDDIKAAQKGPEQCPSN